MNDFFFFAQFCNSEENVKISKNLTIIGVDLVQNEKILEDVTVIDVCRSYRQCEDLKECDYH